MGGGEFVSLFIMIHKITSLKYCKKFNMIPSNLFNSKDSASSKFTRFMRKRQNPLMRNLLTQTRLDLSDFIYPLFVIEGENEAREIKSMPDLHQFSIDKLLYECEDLVRLGINNILLFGVLEDCKKDAIGSHALSSNHIVANATKAIKSRFDMLVTADLCFCEYTSHGHCGVLKDGNIDNDKSVKNLGDQAVILAQGGADIIAPSASLDGMVLAIRIALDNANFQNTPIMSYSTKFASAYYGPFRDIARSTPNANLQDMDAQNIPKNRLTYQQNYANINEALLESLEDEAQGADILMVKPGLVYLDVISKLKDCTLLPVASYNVSGEFAMVKFGAKMGLFDYRAMMLENLIALKRAGSDIIISYHAKDLAMLLKENNG